MRWGGHVDGQSFSRKSQREEITGKILTDGRIILK
jgi:hypothetical protein